MIYLAQDIGRVTWGTASSLASWRYVGRTEISCNLDKGEELHLKFNDDETAVEVEGHPEARGYVGIKDQGGTRKVLLIPKGARDQIQAVEAAS